MKFGDGHPERVRYFGWFQMEWPIVGWLQLVNNMVYGTDVNKQVLNYTLFQLIWNIVQVNSQIAEV